MDDGKYAGKLNSRSGKTELLLILRKMIYTQAGLGMRSVGLKAYPVESPLLKKKRKIFELLPNMQTYKHN